MRASHRVINRDDPKANYELCDLPDCVHLTERGECSKLNVKRCAGTKCAFKQCKESRRNSVTWEQRLSQLSDEKQAEIAKKYYGGKTPWKTNEVKSDV